MALSFWEQRWLDKADIVVVGGGLVGLQTATELKNKFPHRKIWVLESSVLGDAASVRNAGFACFGSAGEIMDDAERMGLDNALSLYGMRYQGLTKLIQKYGQTVIGYENSGGNEIFTNANDFEVVANKIDDLNRGLLQFHDTPAFKLKDLTKLGMKIHSHAIYSPLEGAIQSHLLYETVRKHAVSSGVELFSGIQVEQLEHLPSKKWKLTCTSGGHNTNHFEIEAQKLVICTNGYTRLLLENEEVLPARGQVLVTKPIPELTFRGIFHADKGYIYFRSLGSRILIGGARNLAFKEEETTESSSNDKLVASLTQWITETIAPYAKVEIDHQWAGIMGMSNSRLPIIEQRAENLYLGVRMGGMGVALSALVAQKISDLVN